MGSLPRDEARVNFPRSSILLSLSFLALVAAVVFLQRRTMMIQWVQHLNFLISNCLRWKKLQKNPKTITMRDIIGMVSDVTLKIAFCCVTLFTLRDIFLNWRNQWSGLASSDITLVPFEFFSQIWYLCVKKNHFKGASFLQHAWKICILSNIFCKKLRGLGLLVFVHLVNM